MSYFDQVWEAAGMNRSVTVQKLVRNGAQPGPSSQSMSPNMPQAGPTSMSLERKGPQDSPKQMALEVSSIHRRWHDHFGDYNFVIEVDGIPCGQFQKCDGLSFELDEIVYRSSMDPYDRRRPGLYRFGSITLSKGYTANSELWKWCERLMGGERDRRNGAVHLLDDDGLTVGMTYEFFDAWPKKWSGFQLDGKGNGGLVESIELAVERVSIA